MGKFMKKGKMTLTADVAAVMEVGVRTRAKTLALQPNPEFSYLQLRSRRLEKPQFQQPPAVPKRQHTQLRQRTTGGSRVRVGSVNSGSGGSVSFSCCSRKMEEEGRFGHSTSGADGAELEQQEELGDFGWVEASFGENNLDLECAERSTRESTPCSFIRDLDMVGSPGSTVKPSCSAATGSHRARNAVHRIHPATFEMEEFFATAELQQQKLFMDKYNFDIVNDLPLAGRYEWGRVEP